MDKPDASVGAKSPDLAIVPYFAAALFLRTSANNALKVSVVRFGKLVSAELVE